MVDEPDSVKCRQTFESLCTRTLEGTISLDDFYREWPNGDERDAFSQTLHDDLEDAIQHTPGTWFAGKVDATKWKQCPEYFVIYLDLQLLRSGEDLSKLLAIKNKVLSADKVSVSLIDDAIAGLKALGSD